MQSPAPALPHNQPATHHTTKRVQCQPQQTYSAVRGLLQLMHRQHRQCAAPRAMRRMSRSSTCAGGYTVRVRTARGYAARGSWALRGKRVQAWRCHGRRLCCSLHMRLWLAATGRKLGAYVPQGSCTAWCGCSTVEAQAVTGRSWCGSRCGTAWVCHAARTLPPACARFASTCASATCAREVHHPLFHPTVTAKSMHVYIKSGLPLSASGCAWWRHERVCQADGSSRGGTSNIM